MSFNSAADSECIPPPYVIPVETRSYNDNVGVYHVHAPFTPPRGSLPHPAETPMQGSPPRLKLVSYETSLGSDSGLTTCPSCQQQVMTSIMYRAGTFAWIICVLFILCGLVLGCCLIPFFVKHFKDVYHFCPCCRRLLHVHRRTCCVT